MVIVIGSIIDEFNADRAAFVDTNFGAGQCRRTSAGPIAEEIQIAQFHVGSDLPRRVFANAYRKRGFGTRVGRIGRRAAGSNCDRDILGAKVDSGLLVRQYIRPGLIRRQDNLGGEGAFTIGFDLQLPFISFDFEFVQVRLGSPGYLQSFGEGPLKLKILATVVAAERDRAVFINFQIECIGGQAGARRTGMSSHCEARHDEDVENGNRETSFARKRLHQLLLLFAYGVTNKTVCMPPWSGSPIRSVPLSTS